MGQVVCDVSPLSFGLMVPVCKTFWCVAVALIASDFLWSITERTGLISLASFPPFPQKMMFVAFYLENKLSGMRQR